MQFVRIASGRQTPLGGEPSSGAAEPLLAGIARNDRRKGAVSESTQEWPVETQQARAQRYRREAEQLRAEAERVGNPNTRRLYLDIADKWEALAAQLEQVSNG